MPACSACSVAVFDASKRNAGEPAAAPTGSPQANSTLVRYPCGTTSVSFFDIGTGVNVVGAVPPPVAHPGRPNIAEIAAATPPCRTCRRVSRRSPSSACTTLLHPQIEIGPDERHRAQDRHDPARAVKPAVVGLPQQAGHHTADERAGDTEQRRHPEPHVDCARVEPSREQADDEPYNDHS